MTKKPHLNIYWEKTHNPLETLPSTGMLLPPSQELAQELEEKYSDFGEDADDLLLNDSHQDVKCIMTPLGVIPMNEHTDPFIQFNFWTGHTTFGITHGLLREIAEVPGVEVVDIASCTRYRFRVGIGKAFTYNPKDNEKPNDKKVLNAIRKRAIQHIRNTRTWDK